MKKPNIIFILADDMGYGDMGKFGNGDSKTPSLDLLAERGLAFSSYHSPSPVCAPARAGIITGRYPHRTGVIDTLEGCGTDRLHRSEVTLANVYKSAGYKTALIGKWHLGALDKAYHPLNRGFDYFTGFQGGWSEYYDWTIEKDGKEIGGDGEYLTDLFTREAVEYIENNSESPFFIHLTYNAPHFPFEAPQKYVERFKGKFNKRLANLYGMIAAMDEGIGKVIDAVDRMGITKDTVLVFAMSKADIQLDMELKRQGCSIDKIRGDRRDSVEIPPPPPPELYNIKDDPQENHNLWNEKRREGEKLLKKYNQWFFEVERERKSKTIEQKGE